jgi:hypothetical protein
MSEKEVTVRINVEGVSNEASEIAKLEVQLKNLKEIRSELIKQASAPGHFASNEEKLKIAAVNREIDEQGKKQKELKKIVDTMPDSVMRMRAEYNKLKDEYYRVDAAQRDKLVPGIQKLYGEITKAEQAVGVFSRNVGNYPNIMGKAGSAISDLSGAVGGAAGQIGGATSAILTASGPVGIFTALIGGLATAWKRVKENIDLYLASADKLAAGPAAFLGDTEQALTDSKRRARGEIAEGLRAELDARAALVNRGHLLTEEEKKQLELQIQSGQKMQEHGKQLVESLHLDVDKVKWRTKYNQLLQEEERLNDEKLENETKWEALEARLAEQRKIATDKDSTAAQISAAKVESEKIANQLMSEKTKFLDRQITNLNSLADMTATQEVYEDQINGLHKERNSVQREYEQDLTRINKIERTAARDLKADVKDITKEYKDAYDYKMNLLAAEDKMRKFYFDKWNKMVQEEAKKDSFRSDLIKLLGIDPKDLGLQKMDSKTQETIQTTSSNASDQELKDLKKKENEKLAIINAGIQGAQAGADAAFASKKARLQAEMEAELSNTNLTEKQKAAIKKKYAKEQQRIDITQAIINGALAVGNALATTQPFMPMAIIAAALAATMTGIQIATIKAAKYNTGGKIDNGIPVNTGTADNLLIAVNNREAVINERQIARLGGSGAMRKAGVPGFADGGAVSSIPYINPSVPAQDSTMAGVSERLKNIEVFIDIHKVRSALSETEIILQPQKI